ncbi:MAG: UbiA prenyltransferase family protein [Bacteroidales bacterium]|nr:UbiA prenyltransferase family protein [Bacteroidales bacterium]
MKTYLELFRVKEWVKNIIVFAPLFFSTRLFDENLVFQTAIAFIAFCMIYSAVYILNDISDLSFDRQHPTKKDRPIASGKISKQKALLVALFLLLSSFALSLILNWNVVLVLLAYLIINLFYSLWLKNVAIVDVFVISLGFALRLLAGAKATEIVLSDWIILLTLLLSVFLVLGKRRQDLLLIEKHGLTPGKSLSQYSVEYINLVLIMMASVVTAIYVMYSISPELRIRIGNDYFKLTSVWIILAFLRYFQLTMVMKNPKSPISLFFEDIFLMGIVVLWMLSCFFFIYI